MRSGSDARRQVKRVKSTSSSLLIFELRTVQLEDRYSTLDLTTTPTDKPIRSFCGEGTPVRITAYFRDWYMLRTSILDEKTIRGVSLFCEEVGRDQVQFYLRREMVESSTKGRLCDHQRTSCSLKLQCTRYGQNGYCNLRVETARELSKDHRRQRHFGRSHLGGIRFVPVIASSSISSHA